MEEKIYQNIVKEVYSYINYNVCEKVYTYEKYKLVKIKIEENKFILLLFGDRDIRISTTLLDTDIEFIVTISKDKILDSYILKIYSILQILKYAKQERVLSGYSYILESCNNYTSDNYNTRLDISNEDFKRLSTRTVSFGLNGFNIFNIGEAKHLGTQVFGDYVEKENVKYQRCISVIDSLHYQISIFPSNENKEYICNFELNRTESLIDALMNKIDVLFMETTGLGLDKYNFMLYCLEQTLFKVNRNIEETTSES